MIVQAGETRFISRGIASCGAPRRVVVLVSHPIQYFAPVYRALARRADLALTVVFHCRLGIDLSFDAGFGRDLKWDIPLVDGYDHRFLSASSELGRLRPTLIGTLRALRPDVLIVHGYGSATNLLGIAIGKLIGAKVLMRGDTRVGTSSSGMLRSLAKRVLFRALDGFLSIGSANEEYYRRLGVAERELLFAPFCVDNAVFQNEHPERELRMLRTSLAIPEEAVVVCFAGKLVEQKRPLDLLKAFAQVSRLHPELHLLYVGSGEQEPRLRSFVRDFSIDRVVFAGFRNQSELPLVLAACDLFVLPSEGESWGLAVNEAMAAGLPVIVSDGVGAAPDLVENRDTGIVYRCADVGELANAIARLAASPELRARMGANARKLIAQWDVQPCADAIAAAVCSVCGAGA